MLGIFLKVKNRNIEFPMDIETPAVSPASLITLPMLPNSGEYPVRGKCCDNSITEGVQLQLHNKISSTGHFALDYKKVLLTSMYLLNQGK